jgi:anti-anti-sigma factor
LVIDFSKLDYFGSTFVGILIRLAKRARGNGGEAYLCCLSDNMRDMLKTLMLLENTKTDFFWIPFPDQATALAALAAKSAG